MCIPSPDVGVELDARAALVPGQLEQVLVEQAPVAVRAPAIGGDEVVDVEMTAADEVREQAVASAGSALVAVEDGGDSVAVHVPSHVAPVELILAQPRAQLVH